MSLPGMSTWLAEIEIVWSLYLKASVLVGGKRKDFVIETVFPAPVLNFAPLCSLLRMLLRRLFLYTYILFFLYTNYQIMNSYISKWNTVGNTIEIDTNATKTSLFFVSASLFLLHPSIMSVLRHASALSGGRQSAGNPCHALPGQLSFQRASYTSAEWRQPQAALGSFHQRCVHNCVRFKVELHSAWAGSFLYEGLLTPCKLYCLRLTLQFW